MDLITHVESMCDPDTDAGEWINRIDLREKGPWLLLMDMKQVGWYAGRQAGRHVRDCASLPFAKNEQMERWGDVLRC